MLQSFRPNSAALSALAVLLAVSACSKPPPQAEPVRPVHVVQATPGENSMQASYAGDVRARYESTLGFRLGGKIVAREVDAGDRVRKGQVLARLDPDDARLNIAAARSQLEAAKADLALKQADLARFRDLYDKKFISAAEFERHRTGAEVAEAQLDQAEAQLGVIRNQSDYTALRAYHDGVITAIIAEVGQVVETGQAVLKLARTDEKEVVINIPENRLPDLKRVEQVRITLWANPEQAYAGRIREVSPTADAVTRTYAVKIAVTEPDPAMQLGMTATVELHGASVGQVIKLPLTALSQKGNEAAVWVVDPASATVKLRPVQVAQYGQDSVSISAGLTGGEQVVRAGVHKLHAGEKVRVLVEVGK